MERLSGFKRDSRSDPFAYETVQENLCAVWMRMQSKTNIRYNAKKRANDEYECECLKIRIPYSFVVRSLIYMYIHLKIHIEKNN